MTPLLPLPFSFPFLKRGPFLRPPIRPIFFKHPDDTNTAVTGDICSDLDSSVTSILDNGSESAVLEPLIDYYTGDCSESNAAVESIAAAQEVAEATIGVVMDILSTVR